MSALLARERRRWRRERKRHYPPILRPMPRERIICPSLTTGLDDARRHLRWRQPPRLSSSPLKRRPNSFPSTRASLIMPALLLLVVASPPSISRNTIRTFCTVLSSCALHAPLIICSFSFNSLVLIFICILLYMIIMIVLCTFFLFLSLCFIISFFSSDKGRVVESTSAFPFFYPNIWYGLCRMYYYFWFAILLKRFCTLFPFLWVSVRQT